MSCNDDSCPFTNCNGCKIKDRENIVTEAECFSEGNAGKCGLECRFYGYDGCDYEEGDL